MISIFHHFCYLVVNHKFVLLEALLLLPDEVLILSLLAMTVIYEYLKGRNSATNTLSLLNGSEVFFLYFLVPLVFLDFTALILLKLEFSNLSSFPSCSHCVRFPVTNSFILWGWRFYMYLCRGNLYVYEHICVIFQQRQSKMSIYDFCYFTSIHAHYVNLMKIFFWGNTHSHRISVKFNTTISFTLAEEHIS